jgi:hypothetical protein
MVNPLEVAVAVLNAGTNAGPLADKYEEDVAEPDRYDVRDVVTVIVDEAL